MTYWGQSTLAVSLLARAVSLLAYPFGRTSLQYFRRGLVAPSCEPLLESGWVDDQLGPITSTQPAQAVAVFVACDTLGTFLFVNASEIANRPESSCLLLDAGGVAANPDRCM